jgi:hypothetical protein
MDNNTQDRKGCDPEAGTPMTPPATTSQVNTNVAPEIPIRTNAGTSEHLNDMGSVGSSAPTRDNANNSPSAENLCVAKAVADKPHRTNTTTIALAVFGISAIVCSIIVLGVCLSGNCGSSDSSKDLPPPANQLTASPTVPANQPTASPTVPPTAILAERAITAFVQNISYLSDTETIFVNGTSAESRALTWLSREDTLFNASALLTLNSGIDNEVSFRVRQRYPLVTLWFQQVNEEGNFINKWTNTSGWLESESECEWFGIACDANGSVIEISFYESDTEVANGYAGSIPPDIGLLTSLQLFVMDNNDVVGTIPESIGLCNQMMGFSVYNCTLSGTIPSTLGQWTDIGVFDVSRNKIHGTIPDSAGIWTNIVGFSVFGNQLTGSIPAFIVKWSRLKSFSVSFNRLTNTIPEDIGNFVEMVNFLAQVNSLQGTLPSSIGRMTALKHFLINVNQLTGTIPSSVGNWSQISEAYFDSNNFTGTMPTDICANIQDNDVLTSDCNVNCSCCTDCIVKPS